MSQLEFLAYAPRRATYRVVGLPRTFVTFFKTDDLEDAELEAREAIASEMRAIKTTRRARPRANHELARKRAEVRGEKWLVRIYYRSEGNELLCFDAGPFTKQTADRVAGEHKARQVYVPDERPKNKRRKSRTPDEMYRDETGSMPSAEVFDRDEVGADAIAQDRYRKPGYGARLVVLPSQRHEAPALVEDELVLQSA